MGGRLRIGPVGSVVLLTIGVRALIAMSRVDELELEMYQIGFAEALLAGMPLDPAKLPIIDHLRGSVFASLISVPFVALFGSSMWTLKLMAVLSGALAGGLIVRLLDRHVSRTAAWVGVALYPLMPPSFQMVDVLWMGSHGDVIPFFIGTLLFVLSRSEEQLVRSRDTFVFGLLCGIGLLYSMQYTAMLPWLVVAWVLRHRQLTGTWSLALDSILTGLPVAALVAIWIKLASAEVHPSLARWWQLAILGVLATIVGTRRPRLVPAAFFGGALIGGSLIPFLSRTTKIVNRDLNDRILADGVDGAASKFWTALVEQVPRSWLFREEWLIPATLGWVAHALFLVALLVSFAFVVRRALRLEPLAVFAVGHPFTFLVLYAATDLKLNLDMTLDGMGSRYVMPALATQVVWFGIGATDVARLAGGKLGAALGAAPALAGLVGVVALVDPGIAFTQPLRQGTRLAGFRDHFEYAEPEDLDARLRLVHRLDESWIPFQPLLHFERIALPALEEGEPWSLLERVESAREESDDVLPYLLFAIGSEAARDGEKLGDRAALRRVLVALEEHERPWFLRGVGDGWRREENDEILQASRRGKPIPAHLYRIFGRLPERDRAYAAQGAGFTVGTGLTPYERISFLQIEAAEARLDDSIYDAFFQGVGLGFRIRFVEETWRVPEPGILRSESVFSERALAAFRAGLAAPVDRFPDPPGL